MRELTFKWVMNTTFSGKSESGCLLKITVGPILGGQFPNQFLSMYLVPSETGIHA